jgi:hypothetical protein
MMSAPALSTRPSVIPDSSKQLSDGVVIQASVLARLLGVKLLTVDATVLVSPAQLDQPETERVPGAFIASPSGAERAPLASRVDPTRYSPAPAPLNGLVGSRLGLAARMLDESTGDLRSLDGR